MRTKSAIANSSMALVQKFLEIVLGFVFRTVLIYTLGNTYLGISGLFTNIFSLLSLMELGVGASIVYLIYKPLNDKDYETLKSFLNVYSKFYTIVGLLIGIIGIILIPFLPSIIKDYNSININLIPIYLLTLGNVVFSYFLAHRRSLLDADQKAYINSFNFSLFNIIGTIFRVVILLTIKNYNLTLLITLIITIISNLVVYYQTNKIYPFLKEGKCKKLPKEKVKELISRMGASTMHQLGNIVVTSTDNIIISAVIGVIVVGKYSNYTMMTNLIYTTFSLIFVSITANIGNMKLVETENKSKEVFNKLQFLNFALYFIACTSFYALVNNLIILWIGKEYLLSKLTVFVITISLYIMGMRHNVVSFLNSSGLNYNTRYKAIVEAVLNLVISLILAKYIGIVGIILGTIISFVVVSVWFEPFILFKHWFKEGLIKYYFEYIGYFILTVLSMLGFDYIINSFNCSKFLYLIFEGILGVSFSLILLILIFGRTENFKYYLEMIKNMCNKIIGKVVRK